MQVAYAGFAAQPVSIVIAPAARYDFSNTVASSDVEADSVASALGQGAGYVTVGYLNNSRVVYAAGISGASAATNNSSGEYFKFSLAPVSGRLLTLDRLSFQARRASSSPDRLTVYLLPTGGSAGGQTLTLLNNVSLGTAFTSFNIPLQDLTYQDLSNVELRFVFHGNNQNKGSNYLDAVQLDAGTR
ncbi:MAG: hypothetical protein HC904_08885 [Blastochloris sp.]|nr:hypothetical protein [Blastochloris sp.]